MRRPSKSRQDSQLLGIVAAVVSVGALYFGRLVFIPFALALLFSLLLSPAVSFLERIKLPRMMAILFVVLTLFGLAAMLGWVMSQQIVELTNQLPSYKQILTQKIRTLQSLRSPRLSHVSDTLRELEGEMAKAVPGASPALAKKATQGNRGSSTAQPMAVEVVPATNPLESVESIFGPIANAAVVAVFTIFMLVGREDLRNRFIKLAGGTRLNVMTRALDETTRRINRYLLLQLIVNTSYGVLIGIVLHFIGIPNAPLWGVAAAILRFLPYVGPPLAALMPILLSLAVFTGWWHALATFAVYLVLELVVANVIEPIVYGSHIGLSPLAILVAAVFWTLIWGFPGLLLSTPLTVCLVVLGRHSPGLAFLSVLLGDEPVLTPQAQYYQRLLATDQNEASQVLEQYLKEHSLEETYSSVLLPALSLAEQDRHRNELDEDKQAFFYQSTRELIEEYGSQESQQSEDLAAAEPSVQVPPLKKLAILCIPARDEADDVVALLLCQLLERAGFNAQSLPIASPQEMLSQVTSAAPQVVCISALPPFALEHARGLYRRLRNQFSDLRIVICFWQFEGDIEKMAVRFKLDPRDRVITKLPQVLELIREQARG